MAKKTTKKTAKKTATKTVKKSTKSAAKPATKKTAKKATPKTSKKTSKKAAAPAASKKASKKSTPKSTAKASPKKSSAKATEKAPKPAKTAKKATAKLTKKTAKSSAAKSSPKASSPKPAASKSESPESKKKSAPTPEATTKPAASSKETDTPDAGSDKKFRSRTRKKSPSDYAPPPRPLLLGTGSKLTGGPLIASTKRSKTVATETKVSKRTKTPFTAKQLDDYKLILLKKRAELVGDIENLEEEALRSSTGETQTASNAAEFGTESFEQGLNLDLAAADRQLIQEIDAALKRIADRTYGLCIESHEPITVDRLAELPWAKYSIETARKHDQRYRR